MSLPENYNASALFTRLSAQGVNLTGEEQQRVDATIRSEFADGDIVGFLRQGLTSGMAFLQILFSSDAPTIAERFSIAWNTCSRFGEQREVNEHMHALRDRFATMGGNIGAAASLITGDTSAGQPAMAGNLRQVVMATVPATAEDLQRGTRLDIGFRGPQPAIYAATDTNEIAPPLPTGGTRTLTSPAQSA